MISRLFAGLAVAFLATEAAPAFAGIAIDPSCAVMAHKVSCTCAMQNGGHTSAHRGQMEWFLAPNTKDAVGRCVRAAGGEHVY
jgi:hypothetical protein